jgi:hypothetical protein
MASLTSTRKREAAHQFCQVQNVRAFLEDIRPPQEAAGADIRAHAIAAEAARQLSDYLRKYQRKS